jgi:hypothetical protein
MRIKTTIERKSLRFEKLFASVRYRGYDQENEATSVRTKCKKTATKKRALLPAPL